MTKRFGVFLLVVASMMAFGTAIAHFSCVFIGTHCYSAQMAPQFIIDSAEKGTILAPITTIIVSLIFVTLGCYALSGAKLIRKLPFLNFCIYAISAVCVVRGLLPVQLWIRHPDIVSNKALIIGLMWFLSGLLFWIGFKIVGKSND